MRSRQSSIVRLRLRDVLSVFERRYGRLDGRLRQIERAADAVYGVRDRRWRIGPADTRRRQPVYLGESARHDRVGRGRNQLDARLVIVRGDVFGIGAVEDQEHILRQRASQPVRLPVS